MISNRQDKTKLFPFPTTSWTLIHKVQRGGEAEAARAMEQICRHYWFPIYAFARRQGFSSHDAEDLTQVFFQRLIASETIQAARARRRSAKTRRFCRRDAVH